MACHSALLLALLLAAALAPAALARKPSHRRLNYNSSPTPSGSSPVTPSSPPYSPPPSSGSSPVTPSTPPYSTPPSSGSSPVTPSSPPYSTPPSSGSSPVTPSSPPYSPPPSSGSSPVTPTTPSPSPPYNSPSSGSSPTTASTPPPSSPPPSTPSPVVIPPVSSSPSGGYGGYGSRSGQGTSGYWGRNSGRAPKILSLLSTIVKIFGGRALKYFSGRKTLLGALKDTNTDPMTSLAREGTASLINAYAVTGFPLTTDGVLTLFNNALASAGQAAQQASIFQQLNEAV